MLFCEFYLILGDWFGLVICHFVLLMFVLVCVVLISEVLRRVNDVALFKLVFRFLCLRMDFRYFCCVWFV